MRNFTRREFFAALSAFPLLLPQRFGSCHPPFHRLLDGAGQPPARALFEQLPASTTGITWQHVNGRSPEYYLAETTGAGCAFFDYDNDGWMDIYLVNSGRCDFYTPGAPLKNALYHNNHDGTFTDVTDKAGVAGGTFGMGVAAGDYDGDGWVDLYITSY